MKILLLGKNSQVGREQQRSLAPLGELVALDRQKVDGLFEDLSDLLCPSQELETLSAIGVATGADPIADVTRLAILQIQTRKELPGIRYVLAKLAHGHKPKCSGGSLATNEYKNRTVVFNE